MEPAGRPYLTTVTRRASYVGPWLPEPISVDPAPDAAERVVLVMHDLVADGGPSTSAARRPVVGGNRVAGLSPGSSATGSTSTSRWWS